jgi:hypothetical protein
VSGLPPIGSDARAGRLAIEEHHASAFKRRETFRELESGSNPAASCLIGREGTSCGCKDRLPIIALPKGTRCPKTWVKRRLALGADRLVCASRTEHKGLLTALVPVERVQLNYSREEA